MDNLIGKWQNLYYLNINICGLKDYCQELRIVKQTGKKNEEHCNL